MTPFWKRALKIGGPDRVRVGGAILDTFHWTKRDQQKPMWFGVEEEVVRKGLYERGDFLTGALKDQYIWIDFEEGSRVGQA